MHIMCLGDKLPYKDQDKQREYQRKWIRNKNLGLSTKMVANSEFQSLKKTLSSEERNKGKRVSAARTRAKKKKMITDTYGDSCFLCNHKSTIKHAFIVHRKDGVSHKSLVNMGVKELELELEKNKNKYVYLCARCHRGVHWCMQSLGFVWEEIYLIVK